MGKFFGIIIFLLVLFWIYVGINNIKSKEYNIENSEQTYDNFENVIKDDVSIMIPNSMINNNDLSLSNQAFLQYSDTSRELYFICYKENITDYSDILQNNYISYVEYIVNDILVNGNYSDPILKNINGLETAQGKVFGKLADSDLDLIYHLNIIKTSYDYYQLITWTTKEYQEFNKNDMFKIVNSFKIKK